MITFGTQQRKAQYLYSTKQSVPRPGPTGAGAVANEAEETMPDRSVWLRGEPALADLLEDPVTHVIMRHDGVTPEDVWSAVARARQGLRPAPRKREEAA